MVNETSVCFCVQILTHCGFGILREMFCCFINPFDVLEFTDLRNIYPIQLIRLYRLNRETMTTLNKLSLAFISFLCPYSRRHSLCGKNTDTALN